MTYIFRELLADTRGVWIVDCSKYEVGQVWPPWIAGKYFPKTDGDLSESADVKRECEDLFDVMALLLRDAKLKQGVSFQILRFVLSLFPGITHASFGNGDPIEARGVSQIQANHKSLLCEYLGTLPPPASAGISNPPFSPHACLANASVWPLPSPWRK